MTRMTLASLALVALTASHATAQDMQFHYPPPSAGSVTLRTDVQFGTARDAALKMDVARPATDANGRRPALIFFNTRFAGRERDVFYQKWALAAASNGLVGIVPDLWDGTQAEDFDLLVRHLTEHADDYGVDREAIAVYAASGNVRVAFPVVEDPKRTVVKAAVMYYGLADIPVFRLDLPVLYVRAGLDRPPLNRAIVELAGQAVMQNAPLTLLNHPTGHHAFELRDDDGGTAEMIERTADFVKRATAAPYQKALRTNLAEAKAAGQMLVGDHAGAAEGYAALVAAQPDNAQIGLAYGEALLADRQFAAACAAFDRLRGRGLGPRDLGLPAARACMQKGDADAAMTWLQSIPTRFLPSSVATEPVFAPLAERADFRALFPPR